RAVMLYGDVDNDGSVSPADADQAMQTFLRGMATLSPDANAVVRGDVNGDGVVDIIDAQLILLKKNRNTKR
ncbi:MAG: dockerin type I repeat-containing protein, partial [Oscillospiraceae bacterium]